MDQWCSLSPKALAQNWGITVNTQTMLRLNHPVYCIIEYNDIKMLIVNYWYNASSFNCAKPMNCLQVNLEICGLGSITIDCLNSDLCVSPGTIVLVYVCMCLHIETGKDFVSLSQIYEL